MKATASALNEPRPLEEESWRIDGLRCIIVWWYRGGNALQGDGCVYDLGLYSIIITCIVFMARS